MTDSIQGPVFVSGEAARAVFCWEDAIRALQAAYAVPADAAALPLRTVLSEGQAWFRTLPAMPPGSRYFGAKLMGMEMAVQPFNLDFVIVLYDRTTSRIAAFLDAGIITGFRTAATSAAALDRMARKGPASLGVLGSGLEATMHVRGVAAMRELTAVKVFSPTPERRQAFAEAVTRDLGVKATAVASEREAVEGSDIVLAAARSRGEAPILYADWLAPGSTVISIGSVVPNQREIDVSVAAHCDLIVCDVPEEVLNDTGDMLAAKAAGVAVEGKTFSLADLMSGKLDQRLKTAKAPMFKSVGAGIQDVVVAQMILTKALEAGLATPLPIKFERKS